MIGITQGKSMKMEKKSEKSGHNSSKIVEWIFQMQDEYQAE